MLQTKFRLSEQAQTDVIDIYVKGQALFGTRQADRFFDEIKATFVRIASFPLANRERHDVEPSIRIQTIQSHLIIYRIDDLGVIILRVVHGHFDWQNEEL